MRKASPPTLATLILMTATSTVTLNMIVPSLANIARDLEADYALISFALSGYLAVTAAVQFGVGPLSDRIGRRPVLLAALVVFTLASFGCALAQNVWMLLAFRMLQAAVVSGYVLSSRSCAIPPRGLRPRGCWAASAWRWRWPRC
jgi:MFS family permease